MDIEIRPIGFAEIDAFQRAEYGAFGEHPSPEDAADDRTLFEVELALGAFDGNRMVGTAGAYAFDLTLPGLTTVRTSGVSYVGVLPTHRRRGILRALMERQLDDVRGRGEPFAILTASEGGIYGRFGYGMASSSVSLDIDTSRAAFLGEWEDSGRLTILTKEEASEALPPIFDRYRRTQTGEVTRHARWWGYRFLDRDSWRDGASAWFYVLHESEPGSPDGYVAYRVKSEWEGGMPQSRLIISELVAENPQARAALWSYCLKVDLVRSVRTRHTPVDEPLRWMLEDTRQFKVVCYGDFLWVRLVDIAASLAARHYRQQGSLVFDVSDPFMPENNGVYALVGWPEAAECSLGDAAPDLALDVGDLGAAYLGGVTFSTLARAGRVLELTDGALARADDMFRADPLPFCTTGF